MLVGAVQLRFIWVGDTGVAITFVGGFGTVDACCDGGDAFDVVSGVAVASFERGLAPSEKYADTTYV